MGLSSFIPAVPLAYKPGVQQVMFCIGVDAVPFYKTAASSPEAERPDTLKTTRVRE